MKSIKFTAEFLDKFFEDHTIEDETLYNCLKDRRGLISESTKNFKNEEDEHMILNIKLVMENL